MLNSSKVFIFESSSALCNTMEDAHNSSTVAFSFLVDASEVKLEAPEVSVVLGVLSVAAISFQEIVLKSALWVFFRSAFRILARFPASKMRVDKSSRLSSSKLFVFESSVFLCEADGTTWPCPGDSVSRTTPLFIVPSIAPASWFSLRWLSLDGSPVLTLP